MNLVWTEFAWDEYLYWQATDKKLLRRINDLIRDIKRSPYEGIGKPEALKFNLTGKWSRRINDVHRLVYEVNGVDERLREKGLLIIYQCKYHY